MPDSPGDNTPIEPSLVLSHDSSINYAFQQNAIPIVKVLQFKNNGIERKDLVIRISTEPGFATSTELRIRSIEPNGEFRQSPLDLKLSHDFLAGLNEKVVGWLKVEVFSADNVICSRTEPISLLARNEWCGLIALPEILGAFVLPNDPALMAILSRASDLLREATGYGALNGYQDKSRKRAWEQVAAIYRAVAELGIRYISPPASFENTGQKVSFPSQVVRERFGTCLDLALLFAALCERVGLNPLVLMHEGHAYAGCWLEERTLQEGASEGADALQYLRKLEADALITVFETTLVTNQVSGTLSDAERIARPYLNIDKPFRLSLDVRRARISRIVPLPLPGQQSTEGVASASGTIGTKGIGSREFTNTVDTEAMTPSHPVTRIDQWKSRLLDLSLRNKLLNFRETQSTVNILSSPEQVEDALAADRVMPLGPKPKVMSEEDPRHRGTLAQQQKIDALSSFLKEELDQGRLHTNLEEKEHSRRLTELYRSSKNAVEENGTNSLFAAVGILEWRESDHSEAIHRAPLLLVPVELKRKSVMEGFALKRLDEETRLNVTLMEMLRQDFQKEIGGLDPLPEDESGVDVGLVFQIFRDAVRDLPGWEVKPEIWLAQFSFAKFLLWKDLSDRLEALTRNRVVKHLIEGAGAPYPHVAEDISPKELDDRYHPREIFCPRSADSSQLAAVMAAAQGHDFVLEGPPGTGKSQTITNIIAHCLAHGKRVLFVAEKRAALDVVYRRLKEEGLEPFCLELHSNKTGKAEVLEQFRRSLEVADQQHDGEWEERAAELAKLRTTLNDYARVLHEVVPCGLSAYYCFDYLLPRKEKPIVRLNDWKGIVDTPRAILERARSVSRLIGDRVLALGDLSSHPLSEIGREEWSPSWSEKILERLRACRKLLDKAEATSKNIAAWLNAPFSTMSFNQLYDLAYLAESLCSPVAVGHRFVALPWNRISSEIETWLLLAKERDQLLESLTGFDENRLMSLELTDLKEKWKVSLESWFLPKVLGTRKVLKQLQSVQIGRERLQEAQVGDVLERSIRFQKIHNDLVGVQPIAEETLGALWNNGNPSTQEIELAQTWGDIFDKRLIGLAGNDSEWLVCLRELLAGLFKNGTESFSIATPIGLMLYDYLGDFSAYVTELNEIAEEVKLRRQSIDGSGDHFTAVRALIDRLESGWGQLRPWCAWQKIRSEAITLGMGSLVESAENQSVSFEDMPQLFERSFRRDLLFALIERNVALRGFFGEEHNERIERFKQLDERLNQLARNSIQTRLAVNVPRGDFKDIPNAETALLRKELGKKKRHIPVRRLLSNIPQLLPRLKPCVLMSPLSVAQYLDATHDHFDLVIFDEASQIAVWDAVGAIARAKQLIVVGDPKQLPPTNFFAKAADEDGDDEMSLGNEDLESILDELMSAGLRHKRLKWHYRSRHEGLITFSNREYYDNELLTFPSSERESGGVKFRYIEKAYYDKGKSRTNKGEAKALVDELIHRLKDPQGSKKSYGVVTFSLAQQQLIEDLLDQKRREHPEVEVHFGDAPPVEGEPIFVKNLESVQGDERDVILFSICYGPDENGKVAMNFGPMNRDGGQRRLNVAITRAKYEVIVFSSLKGDQIDLTRTRARGVRDLKSFLEYAERGPKALTAAISVSSDSEPDSEFELMVAKKIIEAGYEVHHQVGCSGYRIDLAVVDPKAPGRYLLGVECDGATYHRAATARDRDKLRQAILEGLGWKIHRIWSTDWWHDAEGQTKKLLFKLAELSQLQPDFN